MNARERDNISKAETFVRQVLEESDPPPSLHELMRRLSNERLHLDWALVKRLRQERVLTLATKPLTQRIGDKFNIVVVPKPVAPRLPYAERPIAERPLNKVIDEVLGDVKGSQFTDEERARGRQTMMDNAAERLKWAEGYALEFPAVTVENLHNKVVARFGRGIEVTKLREVVKTVRDLQTSVKPPPPEDRTTRRRRSGRSGSEVRRRAATRAPFLRAFAGAAHAGRPDEQPRQVGAHRTPRRV